MTSNQNPQERPASAPGAAAMGNNVKADIVSLDGHQFRVNYDVPQGITDRLYGLFWQDEEVKYEDIPEDLKAYEVRETEGGQ